jgi:3-oxoacyl-[acyl-carrier protein] reductase
MGVVIVAGGATGIGRAVARAFRGQGDSVLLVDSNPQAVAVAEERDDGLVRVLPLDLRPAGAPDEAVAAAIAAFGALDTVFVNAAVLTSAPLADWTAEMWDDSANLNLRMPFLFARAAAPRLECSDNGCIVFTASTGALRGHAGMPAYHATKSGLLGLCRSLADELAPRGTRVNCVLPGWIDTPFNNAFWDFQADPAEARRAVDASIPMRRHGTPEEVAGTILFLASPAAKYITGTSIVVDGGHTAV